MTCYSAMAPVVHAMSKFLPGSNKSLGRQTLPKELALTKGAPHVA